MSAAGIKGLGDRIAQVTALDHVLVRPNTASLILSFAGDPAPVLDAITAAGIARIVPPDPPPQIGQIARFGLLRADAALRQRTEDALDLNATLALLLVLGAVIQAARGQIAGPATTLLVAALGMLDRGRPG